MRWLQPLAWWGLAALAIPVLVHLLARDRSRRLLFPSLRFLRVNQTAALRRRVVQHWTLLTIRILLLVCAVAALAGPLLLSEARQTAWNRRTARAIIVTSDDRDRAASVVADEAGSSVVSATFVSGALPSALIESVEWLRRQPPAAREIVIAGDLREGALTDRDFDAVPPFIGVRFLPLPRGGAPNAGVPAMADNGHGDPVGYSVYVEADPPRSRVRHEMARGEQLPLIHIVTDVSTRDHADALRRAVLRDGVWLSDNAGRRLTFVFRGAPAAAVDGMRPPAIQWMQEVLTANSAIRGGERDGGLVVSVDMAVTDARAPDIVGRVVRTAFARRFDSLAPAISSSTLARWSRPPGRVPLDAEPVDEGDRRWLWGAVLLLLGVEQFVRVRRRPIESAVPPRVEARVA